MSDNNQDECVTEDLATVVTHNNNHRGQVVPTFYAQVFHGMRNTLTGDAVDLDYTFDECVQKAIRTAHTAIKMGSFHHYMSRNGLRAQQKKHYLNRTPLDFKNLPVPKFKK